MGFVGTCALKKNCDADPMARLFVACTKAAHVPEFNPPSMTTKKVVHEKADISADSVPYCTAKLILYTQGVEMGQDIIVLGT